MSDNKQNDKQSGSGFKGGGGFKKSFDGGGFKRDGGFQKSFDGGGFKRDGGFKKSFDGGGFKKSFDGGGFKKSADDKESKPLNPKQYSDLVDALAQSLNKHGLSAVEIDHNAMYMRLERTITSGSSAVSGAPVSVPLTIASSDTIAHKAPAVPGGDEPQLSTEEETGHTVTAPCVGTVYLAPSPESNNYIAVGDTVKKGDTLLIVEALKVMNQIKAPVSGTVLKIMVKNEQSIEFGQGLVVIDGE